MAAAVSSPWSVLRASELRATAGRGPPRPAHSFQLLKFHRLEARYGRNAETTGTVKRRSEKATDDTDTKHRIMLRGNFLRRFQSSCETPSPLLKFQSATKLHKFQDSSMVTFLEILDSSSWVVSRGRRFLRLFSAQHGMENGLALPSYFTTSSEGPVQIPGNLGQPH